MRRRHERWTMAALLTLTFLAAGPLAAGVVYEIEVKDHGQSPPRTESIQAAVEGRHLKMGIASKGSEAQGEMIFRGDRREMVVVDPDSRTYHVIDESTISNIAGQLSGVAAQMQEALKNVPEDRRAMVEQMMKQRMPRESAPTRSASEFTRTLERGDKEGYPCVKYEVLRDGVKLRELWVTDWSNIEGGGEVAEVFEDMADFFAELMDAIPQVGQRGGSGLDDNVFRHMKEIGGFPVVSREFGDDGTLEGEATLRSAKRRTLDPEAFEPPSGYKRQEMFGGN